MGNMEYTSQEIDLGRHLEYMTTSSDFPSSLRQSMSSYNLLQTPAFVHKEVVDWLKPERKRESVDQTSSFLNGATGWIMKRNPRPEEAYESKNAKYTELLEEACNQLGWRHLSVSVNIACGYVINNQPSNDLGSMRHHVVTVVDPQFLKILPEVPNKL
ncbi:hypothetical protein DPMN_057382 [Dreissena polymorpha]|uniref:Uncharacterized protein n=1 Tax=Dreissena polymorpha TaxID=45954 RepID=A0A9D4C021_DREPO|nr:hypothetical protein DPMN_057382 [Dreissena polymorpha]